MMEWISVEERLPPPNITVIVWPYPVELPALLLRHIKDDGVTWFFDAFPVTHWMPLPEPPK